MARTLAFLYTLSCVFVVVSCDPSAKPNAPGCYFDEEVKYLRWVNLTKKFADTLHLSLGEKTATYALSYSNEGKTNTIIEIPSGRSISGLVTKYKNVYFLNEKQDSVFQIYAFTSKKKNSIIGLTQLFSQQGSLYSMVSSGHDDGLIIEQKGSDYLLEADKKKLLKIYSAILLEAEAWEVN